MREQGIPLILTFVTFLAISALIFLFVNLLNLFPAREKIIISLRPQDILIGLTIYLKTSIDFAIFIGNLMHTNPGVKKRIAIEIGTALGNAAGTFLVLIIWYFLKQVPLLLMIMIIIAALVLLRMAEESFEELLLKLNSGRKIRKPVLFIEQQLSFINSVFKPILGKIIPDMSITNAKTMSFGTLILFSLTIPFILGLDDFAGYIPLFSIVNVVGFAIGVFFGHMILNAGLFIAPNITSKVVRTPVVLAIGGIAFVGIACFGFYEVVKLAFTLLR